jgi:hypothetical protein
MKKWIITRKLQEVVVNEADTIEEAIRKTIGSKFIHATTTESTVTGGAYYKHSDPAFFNLEEKES